LRAALGDAIFPALGKNRRAKNMAAKKHSSSVAAEHGTVIQLKLSGLILFSLSLVFATGLLTFGVLRWQQRTAVVTATAPVNTVGNMENGSVAQWQHETPPWGDLVTYNIELQKPDEYAAFESNTNQSPAWKFPALQPPQVRELLLASGLTTAQAAHALSPGLMQITATNTLVQPDESLLLGLTPAVRAKLYGQLALHAENHYAKNPFVFGAPDFATVARRGQLNPTVSNLVTRLLYPRGNAQCFSDIEFVLRSLPDEASRLELVKVMSAQSATLVRLQIHPDTDVDKLLGYWAAPINGVRVKDVRPLLDSLKRVPDGATVSLLYFLPQFARQRLYTFPMPQQGGDPMMDCHWSTMNFFNETPDNRFNDSAYLSQYVKTNFYEIAKATAYGDVVFLQQTDGTVLHSAVYIAGDIVFTKNGRSSVQPWILMHLKDLMGIYSAAPGLQAKVYRNKNT
jgi:hypothetical protein